MPTHVELALRVFMSNQSIYIYIIKVETFFYFFECWNYFGTFMIKGIKSCHHVYVSLLA
jgi:hypothetical protein